MDRNFYYIAIAFFGMVNGMFSPYRIIAYAFSRNFMAVPLFGSEPLIFYFSSLMLSTATVILGGIPAALYERFDDFETLRKLDSLLLRVLILHFHAEFL